MPVAGGRDVAEGAGGGGGRSGGVRVDENEEEDDKDIEGRPGCGGGGGGGGAAMILFVVERGIMFWFLRGDTLLRLSEGVQREEDCCIWFCCVDAGIDADDDDDDVNDDGGWDAVCVCGCSGANRPSMGAGCSGREDVGVGED